jgi:hypothetical protein
VLQLSWSAGVCQVRSGAKTQLWNIPHASAGIKTSKHLLLAVSKGVLGLSLNAFEKDSADEVLPYEAAFFLALPRSVKEVQQMSCSRDEENLLIVADEGRVGVSHQYFLSASSVQWLRYFRGFTVRQASFVNLNEVVLLLQTPMLTVLARYQERQGLWHLFKVQCVADNSGLDGMGPSKAVRLSPKE